MTTLTAQQRDTVATARSYLGTRWLHQGRTREGIDCIGLVIEVAKHVKGWTYDITDYARQATDETMLNLCHHHLEAKGLHEVQPGDVLIMAFDHQRHAAIVGDYPAPHEVSIIHAYATSRAVVEQRLDTMWSNRVIGCFRFPEGTN
mgnify:CR=1 FL=1